MLSLECEDDENKIYNINLFYLISRLGLYLRAVFRAVFSEDR